jgi:predicted nucleic acid-binding protein
MTRYAIDASVAIRLGREHVTVGAEHQLVAASSLRSQVLSLLYRGVRRGELSRPTALAILDGVTTMRIRLLGDRVSRVAAWRLAEQLGWDDTAVAECVAVAQLQADAFVTLDPELAHRLSGLVATAPFEALLANRAAGTVG